MLRLPFGLGRDREPGASTLQNPVRTRRRRTAFQPAGEPLEGRALLATVTVHIESDFFSQSTVTIHAGDTVHWVWDASPHSTTSVGGIAESWNSGIHNAGFTFDHTFTNIGSFQYFCQIHGMDLGDGTASGMAGTVIVQPAVGATLRSIAVSPSNPTIGLGGTQQFKATGTLSDNSTEDLTSQVTWASASPAVATITSTGGLATGVAAGTSIITASLNGLSASTMLTASASVSPNPTPTPTPTPTSPGGTPTSTPTVTPMLVMEQRMTSGRGATRKVTGFMLFFNTALDSGVAQTVGHYQVVQKGPGKRSHPVSVMMAMYNPGNHSVMLMLGKFKKTGALTLTATGLVGANGAAVPTFVTRL
jgi:plastocyanin